MNQSIEMILLIYCNKKSSFTKLSNEQSNLSFSYKNTKFKHPFKRMTLYQSKSVFRSPDSYIVLQKPTTNSAQSIRFNNNSISILDGQGKIIKDVFTSDCKSFPINLPNDQIVERSLVNSLDEFVYGGKNMSVFFIGASSSGKERLFDGSNGRANNATQQNAMISYFINYALPMFRKKYQRLQIRMKMAVSIKQKLYDCLSQNRYSLIKLQQHPWQGISLTNACTVIVQNTEDFNNQIKRGIKQKNKLVLQYKELYMSYLELDFVRESEGNERNSVVSKLRVFEVPGVEVLGESHSNAKIKEASSAVKSLLNFTALLEEYAKNDQFVPYSQNSILTMLTKQVISSNSLISTFFTFRVDDVPGALATSKFIKPFSMLKQYPIHNQSITFGLIRKYRSQCLKRSKPSVQSDKGFIQNEVMRLQTEQDYQRVMEKYAQLKHKYNMALKAKSEAQLQLIKCEEEKIQIGKTLVEVQIQNTKLLEKLQSKDYQNGKRLLNVENKLAEKQMSSQEMLQKLQQANQSLNQALQSKRDLQVQFIALKRNFLLIKKQLQKVKQDNQALSLDVINITNHNQRLKNQLLNSQNKSSTNFNQRKSIIQELETQKQEQLKREIKNHQQTIAYLKSQVERYKKELVEVQLNTNQFGRSKVGQPSTGKDYERIQLESENMQLANRLKLKQRKIDQIQEKIQFYQDQNQNLQNEVRRMKIKDHQQTQQYRKKLQQLVKNTNYEQVIKQLKDNFTKKDTESLDKLNASKRQIQQLKRTKAQHKRYIRELINLLEEYSPKGVDIPDIKKYLNMDLNEDGQGGDSQALRIKCRRLQEQVKRLKEGLGNGTMTSQQFRESRVKQEYDHLKSSVKGNSQLQKLKAEKNSLIQENRRLTVLLKDGNKMDLNILKKENQQLRKQLDMVRDQNMEKSSISPSTNDQKIVFYEKHIKKIEKERSELLSRCVVAEEQVKNLLAKVGKGVK